MPLRVAIVGAHPLRVAKVLSLILQHQQEQQQAQQSQHDSDERVEYLPLVASFDSYENDGGATIKYLSNVTYHGMDGKQKGTSVAPFFDDGTPIEIYAIGCGIEEESDVQQIRKFIAALGSHLEDVTFECIQPNEEYATMKDETEAYRLLDEEGKRATTGQQTIGPGKMVKFVLQLLQHRRDQKLANQEPVVLVGELTEVIFVEEEGSVAEELLKEFDPEKNRYACRMCREILFSEDDLEDPPHVPAKHQFDWRRRQGSASPTCQSIFLASGMPWMGDLSLAEGKFSCPRCDAKLGIWKWAGTQCSCGSWVTPAVQIPISKVDVMLPLSPLESEA